MSCGGNCGQPCCTGVKVWRIIGGGVPQQWGGAVAAPQPLMAGYDDPEPMAAFGAACGDRHRGLVVNALGYTADSPCGLYCNDADHGSWNEAAHSLMHDKLAPAWSVYTGAGGADPGLSVQYTTMLGDTTGLVAPSAFSLPGTQAKHVARAIEVMNLGVCLLERIEDETEALGAKAPAAPGTTAPRPAVPGFGNVTTFLILAAVVAAVAGLEGRKAA